MCKWAHSAHSPTSSSSTTTTSPSFWLSISTRNERRATTTMAMVEKKKKKKKKTKRKKGKDSPKLNCYKLDSIKLINGMWGRQIYYVGCGVHTHTGWDCLSLQMTFALPELFVPWLMAVCVCVCLLGLWLISCSLDVQRVLVPAGTTLFGPPHTLTRPDP